MVMPTVTIVTATGTYTSPVDCKYIRVYVIGPGGAGGVYSATGTDGQGCGGGAGAVLERFFSAGSYSVTINSTQAVFNGVTASAGQVGQPGGLVTYGGTPGITGASATSPPLFANSGYTGADVDVSGNGGTGMFSSGGRGSNTGAAVGSGYGAGGGGAASLAGGDRSGTAAAVIVTEYY